MKNHFITSAEVEQAVLSGKTVYWMNEGYKVLSQNGGTYFIIGWNVGGHDENFVGLNLKDYNPADFFVIEQE